MPMAAYATATSSSARTHERPDTFKVRRSRWTPDHNTRPALTPLGDPSLDDDPAPYSPGPGLRMREISPRGGAVSGGGLPPRLSLLAALASGRALSPASPARVPPRG